MLVLSEFAGAVEELPRGAPLQPVRRARASRARSSSRSSSTRTTAAARLACDGDDGSTTTTSSPGSSASSPVPTTRHAATAVPRASERLSVSRAAVQALSVDPGEEPARRQRALGPRGRGVASAVAFGDGPRGARRARVRAPPRGQRRGRLRAAARRRGDRGLGGRDDRGGHRRDRRGVGARAWAITPPRHVVRRRLARRLRALGGVARRRRS